MVGGIFLNALRGMALFSKIQKSLLPVLFNLLTIYKHKPKYNLLAIVLPSSDAFSAFVLFRLTSLFTILFSSSSSFVCRRCVCLQSVCLVNVERSRPW